MNKHQVILFLSFIIISSCSVCKKNVGRTIIETDKKDLACSCRTLHQDTLISGKIHQIEKIPARYLVGNVLTSGDKRGIYQYVYTGTGMKENKFVYYNGTKAYFLNKHNLSSFTDSLSKLGFNMKKIEKRLATVKDKLEHPPRYVSQNF